MEDKKLLFRIRDLKQYFPVGKKHLGKEQKFVRANDGISLDIMEGETFGLVGESGCGKSTFGRTLLQLYKQTGGRIIYYGRSVEEFAPEYMGKILSNLDHQKKHCEELRKKAADMREKYEGMADGAEKNIYLNHVVEAQKEAYNKLMDIAALIGGLYCAEDMTKIAPVFQEEYKILSEKRALNNKLATAKEEDKAALEASIKALEDKLPDVKKKIAALKEEYKNHADFAEYESYLDTGINLSELNGKEMDKLRKDIQLIFQDPYSSLNPRMTVGQIIGEGLKAHKMFKKGEEEQMQEYILKTMEDCGLAPYFIHRYPHQFSGGQRQRIGIARSLAVKPKFVVCDEAVSALDVSIQSQIINLLLDLKEENNLTYLFISHDLSVVKYISDRIGVMYLGTMMELGTTEEIFAHPTHPYTEALLSAIPTTDVEHKKEAIILEGDIPSPINPPKGCKFHTRCRYCTEICTQAVPQLEEIEPGHFVACHHKLGRKEEKN